MAKYIRIAMVNAREGQDDQLNDWLDNHHIPELIEAAGYSNCQRYELAPDNAGSAEAPRRYMHIYEFETDDLPAVKARIEAKRHLMTPLSPALDAADMFFAYYKAEIDGRYSTCEEADRRVPSVFVVRYLTAARVRLEHRKLAGLAPNLDVS